MYERLKQNTLLDLFCFRCKSRNNSHNKNGIENNTRIQIYTHHSMCMSYDIQNCTTDIIYAIHLGTFCTIDELNKHRSQLVWIQHTSVQFRMLHTAGILSSALESAACWSVSSIHVARCSHGKHSVMLPLQTDNARLFQSNGHQLLGSIVYA